MPSEETRFASWLNATMQTRGLSQADLARVVGVADAQVSRWRRGQVTPTVHYLQRIADTLEVPRTTLDRLAGYPVGDSEASAQGASDDPAEEAEIQSYQAELRRLLEKRVPRPLWRAYTQACQALADSLAASFHEALATAQAAGTPDSAPGSTPDNTTPETQAAPAKHPVGFQP
jgi:transcriptional regulator with XRE-family HTH domain